MYIMWVCEFVPHLPRSLAEPRRVSLAWKHASSTVQYSLAGNWMFNDPEPDDAPLAAR